MENEEDENLLIGKYMTKLQKKTVETLNIAKELIIIFWRPGTNFHEFQHFLEHPIPEFF